MYLQWNSNGSNYDYLVFETEGDTTDIIQLEEGNTKVIMKANKPVGPNECATIYGDQYMSKGKYYVDLIVEGVTDNESTISVGIAEVSSFSMDKEREPVGRTGGFAIELNGNYNSSTNINRSQIIKPTPYNQQTSFETYSERTKGDITAFRDDTMTLNTGAGTNRISFYLDFDSGDDPRFYLIHGASGEHCVTTYPVFGMNRPTTDIIDGSGNLNQTDPVEQRE